MGKARFLTHGEIALARTMFGNAIDYSRVQMIRRKWWPFQPKDTVMAPTGNMHFHPKSKLWSEDFSREPIGRQGLFIHEMTHIWQSQTRGRMFLPFTRHPFCSYSYTIRDGRPFASYGVEQQAEIVAHLFLTQHGAGPPVCPPRSILPF